MGEFDPLGFDPQGMLKKKQNLVLLTTLTYVFQFQKALHACSFFFCLGVSSSPRIRHRNELTDRDWENAVQGIRRYKEANENRIKNLPNRN